MGSPLDDHECEILRLHYGERWPNGTIAQADRGPPRCRPASFIGQPLREYPRLRSPRISDMLRVRGFTGSPRTVRTYVAAVRSESKPEAFLRLETLPGESRRRSMGCTSAGCPSTAASVLVLDLSVDLLVPPWRCLARREDLDNGPRRAAACAARPPMGCLRRGRKRGGIALQSGETTAAPPCRKR